ncbi:DUF2971 domain-containing protein [Coraliomargarita algicola]|uniref:DUF2971 domain-containing protein n=1 Tax=Coraliomargarita algicola TaxID=3092156 RepID=A0ABZ0RP47_9BACT|nr:DUF2971 domain-containing protein [Coraliomargarita sp. J2-16]WPJ97892.1 DUF2971 domain-containing protein [Coraliomargarita sp. J2-16]
MEIELYRYFASHAFETLKDKMLMLARPSSLNDPFEFLYRSKGQITMAKARRYIKSRMKSEYFYREIKRNNPAIKNKSDFKKFMRSEFENLSRKYFDDYDTISTPDPLLCKIMAEKHFRLSCFTSTELLPHEEILMWSHYAAKHTGVRLKFRLNDSIKHPYLIKKVLYSKERAGLDLTNTAEIQETQKTIIESVRTKAEGWSYEKEYRLFAQPSDCKDVKGDDGEVRSFIRFKPEIILQIDFGINSPKREIERITTLARSEYPHVQIRKANYHKCDYALTYEEIYKA